jgi:yecA family protein
MYDDLNDEVVVFDFDEIASHLLEQGALASPSQVHGCLCGLLSAGAPAQAENGLDALAQALDLVVQGELANRVMQLYTASDTALKDEEFSFFPLLPDDEEDIAQRTEALSGWCDGFLAGFAYAAAGGEHAGGAFSEQCSEALRDIAALAQAEADEEERDDNSEEYYAELVEYLRVAVVNIYLDSHAALEGSEISAESGRPLH